MSYIYFPKLWGFKVPIDNVAFKIFELPVYWYGIIIALAFVVAATLAMRDSEKFGIEPDTIIDVVLFAAPSAIIGARLYYVIFNWGEFNGNIKSIVNIRTGGLAVYGGIIAAVLVAYIFCKVKGVNLLKLLDLCAPFIVLAQAIGRLGNFINQEAFGTNTDLPWGMTSETIKAQLEIMQRNGMNINPDLPVHPTFLYEMLWNIGVFLFLMWFRKRRKLSGEVFMMYIILYGLGRAGIEGLRTDSLMLGNFRVSQILSIALVVFSSILFFVRRSRNKDNSEEVEEMSEHTSILKEVKEDVGNNENIDITSNNNE